MQIFSTVNTNNFRYNGLRYIKNFIIIKQGNTNISIHSAYDTSFQLLASTHFNQIQVNGIIYNTLAELVEVLTTLLFTKETSVIANSSNSGGANTIVQRDVDGFIFNNYFNTTGGGTERNASGMVYFAGFNSIDTFIRSYTPAAVARALNGQVMSINGNAVNLSTTRSTWNTNGTISAVVGQLAWKNYGNGHTIFDASAGSAPDGTVVNNANSQQAWAVNYPTLMGWNGTNTYGVRVDSARVADSAPASDVYAWAKAATKPTYTKSEVGLSNVDNTTDTSKSVNYATTAGSAPANGGTSAAVTINYNNDSNSTFQMLWGSGNNVFGTAGIYCNPSTDAIYAVALYSTSDIRYKDIIQKQYQNIEDLEAISYTWKDKTKGEKTQVGYSAQEVQKYIPDAVSTDENGYLSVNYIQVLIAKIESLEKKINQLENGL